MVPWVPNMASWDTSMAPQFPRWLFVVTKSAGYHAELLDLAECPKWPVELLDVAVFSVRSSSSTLKNGPKTSFLQKNVGRTTFIIVHFLSNSKSIMLVQMVKELDQPLFDFLPKKQKRTKICQIQQFYQMHFFALFVLLQLLDLTEFSLDFLMPSTQQVK